MTVHGKVADSSLFSWYGAPCRRLRTSRFARRDCAWQTHMPMAWAKRAGAHRQTNEQTSQPPLPLPFDFVVCGVPVSRQSTSSAAVERWQQVVADAARAAMPRRRGGHSPVPNDLAVTLAYFYRSRPLDTDNMIKPILDAMKGIVFNDDCQVVDLHAGVRGMSGAYELDEVTDVLWLAFDAGEPFVYVHVRAIPEPLEILP
jgi:crossover junction endodeoxyribonuclease RusA